MFENKPRVKSAGPSWTTLADGSVAQSISECNYYPSSDSSTYEIEFNNAATPIGLILETNDLGRFAIVTGIKLDCCVVVKRNVSLGDILVAVNNHDLTHDEFSDAISYLDMLRECKLSRRLKFVQAKNCSIMQYVERQDLQKKGSKCDMYGFHRSVEYLQKERQYRGSRIRIDGERDLDWVKYLKRIGGPNNLKPAGGFKPSPELKDLVRRGIPVAYRGLVWMRVSLANRYKLKFPSDYYFKLLERSADIDSRVLNDIEKDMDRTFPEHDYFGQEAGCKVLKRILIAQALHNPTIGYCQSLNFVAGMMLLFLEEEDAFWLLVTVTDTLLPHDYYSSTMVGTYVDQHVLDHIVKVYLPNVHSVVEGASLQLPLVTVQWFMCLFVNVLPPETVLRVWDIFLNEGSKALFRVAVALFKLNESAILKAKRNPGDVYTAIKNIGKNMFDAEPLIAAAYKTYFPPKVGSNSVMTPSQPKRASIKTSSVDRSSLRLSTPSLADANSFVPLSSSTANTPVVDVPASLIGIGLAHMGPVTNIDYGTDAPGTPMQDKTATQASAIPETPRKLDQESPQIMVRSPAQALSVREDITSRGSFGERRLSFSGGDVYFGAGLVDNLPEGMTIYDVRGRVLKELSDSSIVTFRDIDPENTLKLGDQRLPYIEFGLSAYYFAKRNQVVPVSNSLLHRLSVGRSAKDYRSFCRLDILKWRAEFRPQVEAQFANMDQARQKWKAEESVREQRRAAQQNTSSSSADTAASSVSTD